MFTDLFIKRPVLALVVSALIVILGAQAFFNTQIRQYPELESSVITVTTVFPGASADLIQGFITNPVQNAVSSTEGADFVRSVSSKGVSTVEVHMKLGENADAALTEVSTKVSSIAGDLPNEALDPVVSKSTAEGFALAYYSFYSETMSEVEITNYLERVIQPALSTVKGVGNAEILGGKTYAMRIWLDPLRMAAKQVSAADIVNAISTENYQSAAGSTRSDYVEVAVNAQTDASDPETFKNFIVKGSGNNIVRLGDVADIKLDAENFDSLVTFDGITAIYIGINGTSDGNPLDTIEAVTERLEELKVGFPEGLESAIAYDSTVFIRSSINEVIETLIEAALIVVVVIFLFLGSFRSVIIPLVTIPLSIIGVLFYLQLMGYSINLLTLLAMVMAIGILVDDAILVVENISRHIAEGKKPLYAALEGAREIAKPVIATTVILVVIYVPVGLLGGVTGALFQEFAFTLVGTVIISTIVALTLSPMMCSLILKPTVANNAYSRWIYGVFAQLQRKYQRTLRSSLQTPSVTVLFAVVTAVLIVLMTFMVQTELAPEEDQGVVFVASAGPDHVNFEYVNKYAAPYIDIYRSYEQDYVSSFAIQGFPVANQAFGGMLLAPWGERQHTAKELQIEIQQKLDQTTGLQSFAFSPPPLPGSSGNTPVEFIIKTQESYEKLYQVVEAVLNEARESGQFFFIKSDFNFSTPEIKIDIDRDRAQSLGVPMSEIGQTLGIILGDGYVSRINLDGRSYKVIPQANQDFRSDLNRLGQYFVYSQSGQAIPLSSLVKTEYQSVPTQQMQFQQLNAAKIDAVPAGPLSDALQLLDDITAEVAPTGFFVDYQGQSRQLIQEGSNLIGTFGFALIITFLVLAAQYNSLRDPLVILVTVPLAIFGAMIPMFFWLISMNIYSQVGLITLIGLISKHGILIVEFANEIQINEGRTPRQAVIKAAALRLRPILMTSCSTIVGILPLVIASGAGAESRQAIGITIVSGFTIGTLFTIFVIPVMYSLIAKQREPAHVALAEPV